MNVDQRRARDLVMQYGWNAVAYQILNPGFSLWFSKSHEAVAGYVRRAGRWVIAGAPVCGAEVLPAVLEELETAARADGCRTCYFGAALRMYEGCRKPPRHSVVCLGSQPVWNPAQWTHVLAQKASVRAQLSRAQNKGVRAEQWSGESPFSVRQMRLVLSQWLGAKRMPPMHFLVEPDTLNLLEDRLVFTAAIGNTLQGYLVASPIPARNGWLIEQIIRYPHAPNGTNELLLHRAMERFAAEGANYVTLGLVPLSHHHPETGPENPLWLRLLFSWVRAHGRRFYNFEGLEAFKSKFLPQTWEPIFTISTESRFSVRTLWAIAAAFSEHKSPIVHGTRAIAMAVREETRTVLKKP